MSDSIWPYWKITAEPASGVYKVVMIAGLETGNPAIQPNEKTLYVCKSLEGFLNIAFSWQEVMERRIVQCKKNGDPI